MTQLKFAITGAGGFLTSRLARHYHNKYAIYPLTVKDLDVTSADATVKLMKELQPHVILHAAALTQTKDCEARPELASRVNVDGAVNVARAASEVGAKLIFLSTEQVFNGNQEPGPYREDHEARPNTVYGQTKLEAEIRLGQELEDLLIVRLSWLFGLPERQLPMGPNLFWNTIKAALSGQSIKLAANEYRGITYVYDVVSQFEKLIDLPTGTYHVGSENNDSTYDTGVYILNSLGLSTSRIEDLVLADREKYKDQPRDIRLDYTRSKSAGLLITPSQTGIDRAIEDFGLRV